MSRSPCSSPFGIVNGFSFKYGAYNWIGLPVAGGVSLARSGLSGSDRGQTSGQGEESKALDGGRHAGRFVFWIEKIGVRVIRKLSWERRARAREAAVGRIYMLYTLAERFFPDSPSSS